MCLLPRCASKTTPALGATEAGFFRHSRSSRFAQPYAECFQRGQERLELMILVQPDSQARKVAQELLQTARSAPEGCRVVMLNRHTRV